MHSGKQWYDVNNWFSICLLILIAILLSWSLKQVDFVMTYMQASIENDMYMEQPTGIETKHDNSKSHVLVLLSNLYGQKQACCVWNQYLVDKILTVGFTPSFIDECVCHIYCL